MVTFTTDGIKNKVALEVQLGKYLFVEYDFITLYNLIYDTLPLITRVPIDRLSQNDHKLDG